MKIAIPIESKDLEGKICPSFGRTPCFLLYETDSKKAEYLENSAGKSHGGAGIKAAQLIADHKIDVLLTPRCGKNAAEVLEESGIKLYKTREGSVKENLEDFLGNRLELLEEIHAGFHDHGEK